MKRTLFAAAIALGALASQTPAHAVGCLSGAAVGGVAGHMAGGHSVLGAAAGCAVGHHEAVKHERESATQNGVNTNQPTRSSSTDNGSMAPTDTNR